MSFEPDRVSRVAAVVLAAGESRRFGSPKQLARIGDRTMLEHVLELAARAGLQPIIAVVPVWLSGLAPANESVIWARNPHPERGMSESLQIGFAALPSSAEAAVVLLGDQPMLAAGSIAAILSGRGARPIVAGWMEGHVGPPVLIERSKFGIVEGARGDAGLRDLLAAHPEWVTAVEMPATTDVDTRAALRALHPKG